MKHIYFFMLSVFFSTSLMAQNFAPVGAEWTMGYKEYNIFTETIESKFRTVKVVGEQMKNGKNCRVISGNVSPHNPANSPSNYVYNENNAVYAYFEDEDMFQKIFDFGAAVGDSWEILIESGYEPNNLMDTVKITVDSIFVEVLDGVSTNSYMSTVLYTRHDSSECSYVGDMGPGMPYKVNSKLGIGFYLFPVLMELCVFDPYLQSILEPKVRCYTDDEITYSDLGPLPSCDYQNVGLIDFNEQELDIFVNQQSRQIEIKHLEDENMSLTLYDMSGKLLLQTQNTNQLDISNIQSGMYIIHVTQGKEHYKQSLKL